MLMNSWKKISSEQLFRHPRLTVIEDEVVIAGKKKIKYLRFRNAGDSVTIICRHSDGGVLLQREVVPVEDDKGLKTQGHRRYFGFGNEHLRNGSDRER